MPLLPEAFPELEALMLQEVDVLRKLLCNLTSEQQALLEKNSEKVYALLEDRLEDMEDFERLLIKLGVLAGESASLEEILEKLDTLIGPENMELRSIHAQLVALLDAIQKQSGRTHLFIRKYGNSLEDYICWAAASPSLHSVALQKKTFRKKAVVQVLEN